MGKISWTDRVKSEPFLKSRESREYPAHSKKKER